MEDDGRVEIRTKAAILAGAGAMGALMLRVFPPWQYPIYPVCIWSAITGWRCPGCGSTRAIAALVAGHWPEAMNYNPVATALAPLVSVILAVQLYSGVRYNRWFRLRGRTGRSGVIAGV